MLTNCSCFFLLLLFNSHSNSFSRRQALNTIVFHTSATSHSQPILNTFTYTLQSLLHKHTPHTVSTPWIFLIFCRTVKKWFKNTDCIITYLYSICVVDNKFSLAYLVNHDFQQLHIVYSLQICSLDCSVCSEISFCNAIHNFRIY